MVRFAWVVGGLWLFKSHLKGSGKSIDEERPEDDRSLEDFQDEYYLY